MKMTYLTDGVHSRLIIRTCILEVLRHLRATHAALLSATGATATTTGTLFITTEISGDAEVIAEARAAAQRQQLR